MSSPGPSGAAPELGLVRVWALLVTLPVVLGGLWPSLSGRASDELPRLSGVLTWQLALLVGPLPLLWAALARPAPEGADARARLAAPGLGLALLVAVTLPAAALAAPFTSLEGPEAAAGLLHAAVVLLATAAWLTLPDGEGGARPTRLLLLGLAAGSPIAALVLRDLLGARPAPLPLLTAPLAQEALLASGPRSALSLELALALPGALLLPGAALVWAWLRQPRARRRLPALVRTLGVGLIAGLVALGVAPAQAEPRVRRVDPVLPDVLRDDAGWPVWVELEGDGGPVELAARGLGLRVTVPARPGERTLLPGVAIGGARRLTLEGRDGPGEPWTPLPGAPAAGRVARATEVVVGVLGDRARSLAAAIVGARKAHVVRLLPRDVAALPPAGDALDLLVVARGALPDAASRAAVVAFAAAGGVVALDGLDDLAALSDSAGQGATTPSGWDVRPLGAGALIGPTDPLGLEVPDRSPVDSTFLGRRAARARRAAFEEAALAVLAPGPDAALGRRAALAALAALGALLLLAPLVARAPDRGAAAGGALVAGLLLAVVLPRAAARGALSEPTWGASAELLEVPAGGRLAARHEVVALAAPRPAQARVVLPAPLVERAASPPRPVLAAPAQAEAELLVRLGGDGEGAGPVLELRADRAARAVARLEPCLLAGPVAVARGPGGALRVENRAGLDLTGLMAFVEAGVVPLGDLPAGGALVLASLPPAEPFERWRLGSTPSGALLPAPLRRLAAAAVGGRSLSGGRLLLIATTPGRPRIASGVAGEQPLPTLVLVSVR